MSFFSFFLISFLFLFWRSHPGPGKAGKVGPEPGRAWHGNREILCFKRSNLSKLGRINRLLTGNSFIRESLSRSKTCLSPMPIQFSKGVKSNGVRVITPVTSKSSCISGVCLHDTPSSFVEAPRVPRCDQGCYIAPRSRMHCQGFCRPFQCRRCVYMYQTRISSQCDPSSAP